MSFCCFLFVVVVVVVGVDVDGVVVAVQVAENVDDVAEDGDRIVVRVGFEKAGLMRSAAVVLMAMALHL